MKFLRMVVLGYMVPLFVFCSGNKKVPSVSTGDNSRVSVDWNGVYKGIVPCADCEGIETVIVLESNQTYKISRRYLGKSQEVYSNSGQFEWSRDGGKVVLKGEEAGQFLVGENRLFQLDKDGKRISGELSSKYEFVKQEEAVTEKYWKLVELLGRKVVKTDNMHREPFLILKSQDNRVNGNGGCNSFMGNYEFLGGNRIKFQQMATTMMACPEMQVEQDFLKVLEKVDTYTLVGDKLTFSKSKTAPMARFEAVYLY